MSGELRRVHAAYERLAAGYDRSSTRWDRTLQLDQGRRWVCQRANGDALEVGIGTGLSLLHYHPDVRLVGVDATPTMLDIARARARTLGIVVDLRLGDAESLDFPDGVFDTVIFTYSLCTIPRPHRAMAEARRVLRGGGSLLFTEHVRSPNAVVRAGQALLDPWFRWREADHLLRDPLIDVGRLGFNIVEVERTALGVMERLHATKPR
jgi:ubiquinone/menaquinone biosynthesis C-methylase UbiE